MNSSSTEKKPEDFSSSKFSPHPRLFAKQSDWDAIGLILKEGSKQNAFRFAVFEKLVANANLLLDEAPLERLMEGRRLLAVSREAIRRISTLASVARLTHDDVYMVRALAELDAVVAFEDWNPSHFLDVGEMALAVAIGYDWLYDSLGNERRERLEEALLSKAIEPSYADIRSNWWIRGHNNWSQVCHGGLVTAAVAIGDRYTEIADKIVKRALENIQHCVGAYDPDGAYVEGPIYWGYGTTFHVILADVLQQATGSTFGLEEYQGFLESGSYLQHVTGPFGHYFNYSDLPS